MAKAITHDQVAALLRDIGYSQSSMGFDAIIEAVIILDRSERVSEYKITDLYREVAEVMESKGPRIERRIRSGVERMFDVMGPEPVEKRLGTICTMHNGKPTNGDFLAAIVRTLRLENAATA